ncbi:MAG: DNA polymerase III subunit delta [Lachnospiraceae bacterium]|nr:DNA polymerase III subunit delta [Lachnospiraceae bacterium]
MQRINEDIKTGNFGQVYLLYGKEAYLRKQYKDKLSAALLGDGDAMNLHYFEGKDISVGEIIDLAETMPFFADRRTIVVENSGLFKSGGEQLAEYMGQIAPTTCFVFVEQEVDKRSKMYKAVQNQGHLAQFEEQDETTLKRWVASILKKEDKKISENTANYLLSKTGTDMENIRMELEKLVCYCLDREVITVEDIDAICTNRVTSHIFEMINAIAEGKQTKALDLYYELLALKEPPMRILFLIARQCNMLLQVKELKSKGFDNKRIGERLGIPSFVAGKNVSQAARFKVDELKRAVNQCVEAEEAVKTGRMNDVMSVEVLIMSVLRA